MDTILAVTALVVVMAPIVGQVWCEFIDWRYRKEQTRRWAEEIAQERAWRNAQKV